MKHKNYSPIKIGYSSNSNPKCRINCMQTYSPFGVELIGIILCYNPIDVEKEIHKKFNQFRNCGEWFSISKNQALDEIEYYNSIQTCNEIINLLPIIENSYSIQKDSKFLSTYERFCKIYKSNKEVNLKQLANILEISRQTIYRWIDKLEKV